MKDNFRIKKKNQAKRTLFKIYQYMNSVPHSVSLAMLIADQSVWGTYLGKLQDFSLKKRHRRIVPTLSDHVIRDRTPATDRACNSSPALTLDTSPRLFFKLMI